MECGSDWEWSVSLAAASIVYSSTDAATRLHEGELGGVLLEERPAVVPHACLEIIPKQQQSRNCGIHRIQSDSRKTWRAHLIL